MKSKEAKSRIKINKLLEEAGWRFFDDASGSANILLENNVKLSQRKIDEFGEDFEKSQNGFIDFLLLDEKGFPALVLEAKSEDKNPLTGKEQARKYAKSQNCNFIILSNGNLHYFWNLNQGNPYIITKFPPPAFIKEFKDYKPDSKRLINEEINEDYIALTQRPHFKAEPAFKDEATRQEFITTNKLKFIRKYQLKAVKSIQNSIEAGNTRFLFEMATGTGKTLVSAAVIKLFLRTGNARRVLFLVDRLELEDQANKAFIQYLKNDFKSIIYKENRDDWRKAEIVVSTVQSLLFNNKYLRLFSPTDFDLVISDEAHRSIGGNARALFEFFIGYKLGLTATPKDYIKKIENERDPRSVERRLLLDTYRTFGCESGQPTFRYSLIDGVKEGFLINPIVVDARTEVTTQLLSDKGYIVNQIDTNANEGSEEYFHRDYEKKFFSEDTNRVFCQTFLENALLDPISKEIGKTIIFTVSQNHAAKITQLLNQLADKLYPGKYNSDFAIQVTSFISDAQQFSINFANNNLSGHSSFLPEYKTSKTRVCVTVGMMTTGYDCQDILNICLMRPIFSPTDFIQIKGRGTRKFNFTELLFDDELKPLINEPEKKKFKLFDFFANCEYFEDKFNYDEIIKLPKMSAGGGDDEASDSPSHYASGYDNPSPDKLTVISDTEIDLNGMKIDRKFFERFEDKVKSDEFIKENIDAGNWDEVIEYLNKKILNKPEEYYTLEKIRKSLDIDRRISFREILEKIYGIIKHIKTRDELLDEEFEKFLIDKKPNDPKVIAALKYFFKVYASDSNVRDVIDNKKFTQLYNAMNFTIEDYKAVPKEWKSLIPEYIKDYLPLNQFM
ncbi:MAG: DEAD/DEAH box helicase family protein [Ignavibacteriaceae bacterium]|nr:DEAD/DEAH box helicase family protein [Ignavibacteriaceae bacterium]